jgi:hypothetical protein
MGIRGAKMKHDSLSFPLYSMAFEIMAFEMLPISSNMYSICGYISVLTFC